MKQANSIQSHFGWNEKEQGILWEEVRLSAAQEKPLCTAFDNTARRTGRKANSIRNYYYACIKEQGIPDGLAPRRAVPFVPFTQEEAESLVRNVLRAQGSGRSVRACVTEMAQGDKALALRLQNKYRSFIKSHEEQVQQIVQQLKKEGLSCADPYQKSSAAPKKQRFAGKEAAKELPTLLRRMDAESARRVLLAVADALEG